MGQHKGALLALVFFIGIVVPGLFMFGIDALHQQAFMKVTAEVGEIVKEEGGVTEKVAKTVNDFHKRGYEITFKDSKGQIVSSAVDYGETIVAHFTYTYTCVFKERILDTENKIEILKRNSKGSGNIDQGGILKKIDLTSDETTSSDAFVQTFKIPGLKSIRGLTSDNGSAQVIGASGEDVTIRMKNGSPTRQEQVNDGEAADTKYVDNQDGPYYDKDGYKGTLEKYVTSGEYVEGDSKFVTNQDSEDYNKDGYVGKLERYLASGNYLPEDSKEVTDTLRVKSEVEKKTVTETVTSDKDSFSDTIDYNKDGYKGTLSKQGNSVAKIIDGEYIPADSKKVTEVLISDKIDEKKEVTETVKGTVQKNSKDSFPETIEYNKDGYSGILTKDGAPETVVISGSYIPADTQYIEDYDSPNYNLYGYVGTLEKYTFSGSPAGSKIAQIRASTNEPTWHKNVNSEASYPYNDGEYTGTLYKKSEAWRTIPQSVVLEINYTQYSTDPNATEFTVVDYEKVRQDIADTFGPNNPDGVYLVNPTIDSFAWNGGVQSGSFNEKGSTYGYKREATVLVRVDGFIYDAIYEGEVTKPDTRVYKYRGYVTKPEEDTRMYEYRQFYKGIVTKPEEDTRVYKYEQEYSGLVEKSSKDSFPETIEYSKEGYVGTLTKDGEAEENLASGEYLPADEKYVEKQDSPYYDQDGYTGTLERYVASGEYIPEESRIVRHTLQASGYDPNGIYFAQTIGYTASIGSANGLANPEKYSGVLNKSGSQYLASVTTHTISTADNFLRFHTTNADFSDMYRDRLNSYTNEQMMAEVGPQLRPFLESLGYRNIRNIRGELTSQAYQDFTLGTWARYVKVIFDADYYTYNQLYTGVVKKPGEDTRVYKYRGTVKRPESDTREFEYVQKYKGIVTRPEEDTRIYKYQGVVERPLLDTRVFKYRGYVSKPASPNSGETKNFYQYNMILEYEAWR